MRPDHQQRIIAGLWRWREGLGGLLIAGLGLWLALAGFAATQLVGYGIVLFGAAVIFAGVQRARFRPDEAGPGIVVVREAEVTYFGPLDGGSVNIGSLGRLELERGPAGARWLLSEPGRPPLGIPVNAGNAEVLFDVFAALPGIRTGRMLALLEAAAPGRALVWESLPAGPPLRAAGTASRPEAEPPVPPVPPRRLH